MRGFSSRLRFLAASGWCRTDIGEPPLVGAPIFVATTHWIPPPWHALFLRHRIRYDCPGGLFHLLAVFCRCE